MKRVRALRGLVVSVLLACGASGTSGAFGCAGHPPAETAVPVQLEPRQLIVAVSLVTPALRSEMARKIARSFDLTLVGAFPLASIDVHCIVFEVPPEMDYDGVATSLATYPGVELVQPNQRFETSTGTYSDPYASFQHGAESLRAREAHRFATGRGVRVGVVDTGVDRDHPDLADRVPSARNFVEGGEAAFLHDVHGTAVAGVVAARADDGVGIYGVAPDAELVVAKACWHSGSRGRSAVCSSWTLARAIDFALRSGVRVLNLSLAGPRDSLLTRLLESADASGVVVVAAIGPGGRGESFPASLETVIAVAAESGHDAKPASGSGAGRGAFAAPGHEILTTAPGASYRFLSGSSLAAAHVSGAVALLLERDPTLTPRQVVELLASTARGDPAEDAASSPEPARIDACAAVAHVDGRGACS